MKRGKNLDISIMQPYLFPYICYFQMINCSDVFVVADDLQFIKGGWINRNCILMDNAAMLITLALVKGSSRAMINERCFVDESHCSGKNMMLNKICNAYRKAPYFNECYELIEKILNYGNNNVAEFVYNSLKKVCAYLNITTILLRESKFDSPPGLDAQDKIIYICKELKAKRYINAIGGIELYSAKKFEENGLKLKFIQCRETLEYKQFKKPFVPGLSIIDVMMFNSVDEIQKLLTEFDLVDGKKHCNHFKKTNTLQHMLEIH